MKKTAFVIVISLLCMTLSARAEQKSELIAIKGATIIPVVGADIPEGIILIQDGHILEIGSNIDIPQSAEVIDATGLFAYPGMIDSYCTLGLSEIGAVRATQDSRETGKINPQVCAVEALRPDSMHIPISRSNGITTALVAPSGGLISGKSGLIRLVGWTPEEMIVKSPLLMHIQLPGGGSRPRAESSTSGAEQASKKIKELKELFNEARYYKKRKAAAKKDARLTLPEYDEKLEFFLPVVERELPVMISVYTASGILDAIKFVQEEKIEAVFYGVNEGWKVAKEIKESGIPVVLGSLYGMPSKWEDGYDALYRNPCVLSQAGVKIAFSSSDAALAKDLPYHASKAAAFGLDRREALKGVTIYPAEIFGIADMYGSLEKGKVANIVLADGDILELRTNVTHVFIDGKEMDLSSIYTELLEKFKKRNEK
ncbi:amidohydrolase family protein [Acidobacteriota bacterium]